MQRVLSIQAARGFGESSEFVTKRSCISFLFAIGFLCLLGGFMLGRFAVHRNIMAKAERTRLQLFNNGLEMTRHLQYDLLNSLQDTNFLQEFLKTADLPENQIDIFLDFKLIDQVLKLKSCSVGKVQGSREPDRYVILSFLDKDHELLSQLLKSLNKIHLEQEWKPRRTIFLCVCEESSNECLYELSNYVQSKVVAFITQTDNNLLPVEDCLLVSGSYVVEDAVQEAVDFIKSSDSKFVNLCDKRLFISANLDLDLPQTVLSLVDSKQNTSLVVEDLIVKNRRIAQVIALSIWRLSESIILPWSQNSLNATFSRILKNVEDSRFFGSQDYEKMDLQRVADNITNYIEKIYSLELTNFLNVRIANDFLMDLDKIFLCLENYLLLPMKKLKECYKNLNTMSQI